METVFFFASHQTRGDCLFFASHQTRGDCLFFASHQTQNFTRFSLFPSVRDGDLRGGARHREHETDDKSGAGARRLRPAALLLESEADPALCRRAHPQQGRVGKKPGFFF